MLKKVVSFLLSLTFICSGLLAIPVSAEDAVSSETSEDAVPPETYGNNPTPLKAWYNKPATNWETEALPLGNGYMGAMVFGGVETDEILLNEKTIWSGGPGANPNYNGGHNGTAASKHTALQTARQNLQDLMTDFSENKAAYLDGDGNVVSNNYPNDAATVNLINSLKGEKNNFGSYQELGSLFLEDPELALPKITRTYADKDHKNAGGSESVKSLFDKNINTKFYADSPGALYTPPYTIEWDYSKPMETESYSITTGNDTVGRDPKNWKVFGSTDGTSYVEIDTVTGFSLPGRKATQTFEIDAPGSYQYFRMVITELNAQPNALQMSELSVIPKALASQQYSNYSRELDLDNGLAKTSYTQNNVNFERKYFVSHPNNIMVVELTASESGKINQFINVGSAQTKAVATSAVDTITVTGWPVDHNKTGAETDFDNTLHFAQEVKVVPTGGTIVAEDGGILVKNADSILIITTAGTNYQQSMDNTFDYFTGTDPMIAVHSRIVAVENNSFDELYAEHALDYKELFARVDLNLMNVTFPSKPTDKLVDDYAQTNTQAENRYLEMLYYQFGRYLLISSSREGSLPANLQGIWAKGIKPPWDADYHTNINLQMNYWPVHQTNLSECHIPMVEYAKSLVPRGTLSAQHGFVKPDGDTVRGWTIWHENNIWGNTAPANSSAFFSPEDAAWICQDVWEYYQFTGDEQFLEDNYDVLVEAALFWVDTLWEDTRDGTLVANPSYSPEHGAYSLGATEVQGVIWGIFDEVILASDIRSRWY